MTGLEILLAVYLAGAVGVAGIGSTVCIASDFMKPTECIKTAAVAGVAWPAVLVVQLSDD